MLVLDTPELLLAAVPLGLAYRHWGRARGVTGGLRIALMAVLLLACCGPRWNAGGRGLDVIVVADRSKSMAEDERLLELIRNVGHQRGQEHRLGVVTFGREARVEQVLSNQAELTEFTREIAPDGSDLEQALQSALTLVDPRRPARILVFSDGEANGSDPGTAARRARELEVPIDYRLFERRHAGDIAVDTVDLPAAVAPGEPFQFSVWIDADNPVEATIAVLREGQEIARQQQMLRIGRNRVLFRDVLDDGGFYHYEARVETPADPVPENNRGIGIVRVEAGPRLLILSTDDRRESRLVQSLREAGLSVDAAVAGDHPLTQDALDPYRAVLIENIPASRFGRLKLERLAQFVEDLGGGLLLTGGERSFGSGGYFKSPIDPVLPVSLELQDRHRKSRVALAVALDRSGSMRVPVGANRTKMDLADLGTAESVRLLSAGDSVAILAVDTAAEVIQPLTDVNDPEEIAQRAMSIVSSGGGIFVYEALEAAGQELARAVQGTKHILLFADAADAKNPGEYEKLLESFATQGITVSVIGLGSENDGDAELLKDIARRGGGRIHFSTDAEELPRLFADDTLAVARTSFIRKDPATQPDGIPAASLPEGRLLGTLGEGTFPHADGYNLSVLRPGATQAVVSRDEYKAPWSAFWYRGIGRAAAITFEVDGASSGEFGRWKQRDEFLQAHARWLLGGDDATGIYVRAERNGQEGLVTVEIDPERATGELRLLIVPPGAGRVTPLEPTLVWTGPQSLEARFVLEETGVYRTQVQAGPNVQIRGPALTLPYSPEHVSRRGRPSGEQTLEQLAELTGGKQRIDVLDTFLEVPRFGHAISLIPLLLAASIVLLLVEITGRRLQLWERETAVEMPAANVPAGATARRRSRRWWRRERLVPAEPAAPAAAEFGVALRKSSEVFAEAKDRAKRRME